MGRLIVFEEIDEIRCPRQNEPFNDGRGGIEIARFDFNGSAYPILRRLTDEEVAARMIAPPDWTDVWVCSGCGKRSTDDPDTSGLWRWCGDRYEHGCVGEGQARIYEPARFFGKAGAPKPADDERARFVRETSGRMFEAAKVTFSESREKWSLRRDTIIRECEEDAESLAARLWEKRS